MDNSTELSGADVFAGLSLLLFGLAGLLFCSFCTYILWRLAKHMTGFGFLFSETLAINLFTFQFGIWPGIIILLQRDPLPVWTRPVVNVWTDFTGFVNYEHQVLVALTRFVAVRFPIWYRTNMARLVAPLCLSLYLIALCQAVYLQLQEWYLVVYYDPFVYGFNCEDWSGQAPFWRVYNMVMVGSPFLFYGSALVAYLNTNQIVNNEGEQQAVQAWWAVPTTWTEAKRRAGEAKLMVPCFIHACAHAATYITYSYAASSVGRWGGWLVLVLFLSKTILGPVMLFILTDSVKEEIKIVFG